MQFLCCEGDENRIEGVQIGCWSAGGSGVVRRRGIQGFWRGRGGWR